ncbi:MAG: hypothetical protein RBS08_05840 [Bdellovibrionales bacterium]|jgi:hypothetical protein|nr:hypothetical protein [Bdellovibrionales bacterium]
MDMHNKIDQAIATLQNADAKSFLRDGGGEISMKVAASQLAKNNYPPLPEDYDILLRKAFGITGPYFTLLKMGGMETAGGGLQPGIIETSDAFNKWNDEDEQKIFVFGLLSGGALLIHRDGKYHVIDESSHDVFMTYDDIADFIIDTVTRKDAAIRALP